MKVSYALPTETVAGLVGIVPALEKARLYRGRGGELMRQAACRLVECLALTKSGVAIKTQVHKNVNASLWFGEVSLRGVSSTTACVCVFLSARAAGVPAFGTVQVGWTMVRDLCFSSSRTNCLSWPHQPINGVQVVPQCMHPRMLSLSGDALSKRCRPPPRSAPSLVGTPQLRLLDSIDESLRHAVESVQLAATAALKAVLENWFPVGQDGPSERLRTR